MVTFDDNISGGKITLEYRMPTPDERVKYANEQVVRSGRKVKSASGETRQKYGLRILTGITDGQFTQEGGKPLSSDKNSPHYNEGWKAIIAQYASDVVATLAQHVFENAVSAADTENDDDEEDPT